MKQIENNKMSIEIGMPVYRPSGRLEAVLTALAVQTYRDFFVTIYNDTPPSETDEISKDIEIIDRIRDRYGLDIRHIQNEKNLGYMKNMRRIFEQSTGDILFLLADDDIVSYDCIELLKEAFDDHEVGCLARPYYWFADDFKKAVRFEGKISRKIHKVDLIESNINDVMKCMTSTGQLSGLGFRMSVLKEAKEVPFVEDMFTAHVYPFLYAFSKSRCAYMPYPTVAVSGSTSQCQNDIYDPSPMEQWIRLYNIVLKDNRFARRKAELIEAQVTTVFVGLAQIKNYGSFKELWREIWNYIKHRKKNLMNPWFYIYSVGSIVIPKTMLKKLVDFYKSRVNSRKMNSIGIDYDRFPFEKVENAWSFPKGNERTL